MSEDFQDNNFQIQRGQSYEGNGPLNSAKSRRQIGRPRNSQDAQNRTNLDIDHWTQNKFSETLLTSLVQHGCFQIPVETGIKRQQKKTQRRNSLADIHQTDMQDQVESFFSDLKKKIESQQKEAIQWVVQEYNLDKNLKYFFVKPRESENQIIINSDGSINETPKNYRQYTVPRSFEKWDFKNIQDGLRLLSFLLTPQVQENLQDLLNIFVECFTEKQIPQNQQIKERWKEYVQDPQNKEKFSELLACQFIHEIMKPKLEDIDVYERDLYLVCQEISEPQIRSAQQKKKQKEESKRSNIIDKENYKKRDEEITAESTWLDEFFEEFAKIYLDNVERR